MKLPQIQFRSLRTQIIVCVALPVIATIVALSLILLTEFYAQLKKGALTNIRLTAEQAAEEIEKSNLESITFPKTMALAQKHGLFGDRTASVRYAEEMLRIHPQLTGAYFGYEPNADEQDAEFLAAVKPSDAGALDEDGRFLPYWYRDHEDDSKILLTPLVDMETSYYYQGAKNRALGQSESKNIKMAEDKELSKYYSDKELQMQMNDAANYLAMITEPYVYEGKLIVEQTYPIIIDGEFKGIAGVDRALTFLQEYLEALKPFETAEFVLISRRGRVIAATVNEDWKTKLFEDLPIGDTLLEFYKIRGNSAVELVKGPDGVERFYDSVKVPTGNWTLVMSVEKSEIYAPLILRLTFMIVVTGIGLFVTLYIMVWLANSISARLSNAASMASRVADGDLTGSIDDQSIDETGVLMRAIKAMINNLNLLIGQVKGSSIQLTSTATAISSNAKAQEVAVCEFETSTNSIAAAVKEISTTSQELSNTMKNVTAKADDTASLADSGRRSLEEMEEVMGNLAEANDAISEKLSVISERANNVNRIITTITTVADQTNLLSLNAAIEAEKAGEYGLGFSVVAREIRRLSDQTAVATLDIEQMITEMQTSVASGVGEMDSFSSKMKQSVTGVQEVSRQLVTIIKHVQELTKQFESVRQGMDTQSVGAKHIDEAMVQLKDAAQSTTQSIYGFNRATHDLQDSVKVLRNEVDKFNMS
ncbi:MAG: methyl-accepting chemotaxis protein [Verrucomicrobiota bacterium]